MTEHTRATIVLIVLALLIVPALVRAERPLDTDRGTPLLRLNRGVDVPKSKCVVAGTSDHIAIIDAHIIRELQFSGRSIYQLLAGEPVTDVPRPSPAILRGPPLTA